MTDQQCAHQDPVWLLYHIPKTGGQTLLAAIDEHLQRNVEFAHLTPTDKGGFLPLGIPRTNDHLATLSDLERRQFQIVVGHAVDQRTRQLLGDREVHEAVTLRDPAARVVSVYNYRMGELQAEGADLPDFPTWLERHPENSMARFLSGRFGVRLDAGAIADRLGECDLVARTETMDQWMPYLLQQLGLPDRLPGRVNVSGVDFERVLDLDDEVRALISTRHSIDNDVFERLTPLMDAHLEHAVAAAGRAPATPLSARPSQVGQATPSPASPSRPAQTRVIDRLNTPRVRRTLQPALAIVWATAAVAALVTRGAWWIAIAAAVAGLLGLLAVKISLITAVEIASVRRETSLGLPPGVDERLAAQEHQFHAVTADIGRLASEHDVATVGAANRALLLEFHAEAIEAVEAADKRLGFVERSVRPVVSRHEANTQHLMAIDERIARLQDERADGPPSNR